jgi:O-antigen/teichoic acid export membrane protein
LSVVLGRDLPASDAHRRWRAIARSSATAVFGRALGIAVGFVTVPLTIRYLGAERYGAWVTMLSIFAWLELADLGLGNGLTNAVSAAHGRGHDDDARAHVATAFWLLSGIAAAASGLFALAWPHVSWTWVFNVHSEAATAEVGRAVALAFIFFALGMPLAVVDRVLAAKQQGTIANGWAAIESVAVLVAVIAVTRSEGGMVALVGAISGVRWAVRVASATWLFGRHWPRLRPAWSAVRTTSARLLTRTGWLFFALQVCALVTLSSDSLVITRLIGPEAVTPYTVAWRLFTLPSLPMTIVFPFLWPAYTEALARGDVAWVRRAFGASTLAAGLVAVGAAAPLFVLGQPLIRWWAGASAVPSVALLAWMSAWAVVSAVTNSVACLLNAANRLGPQVAYAVVTAVVNLVLSIVLCRAIGSTGVIAATVIAYCVCVLVPAGLHARAFLAELGGQR